MKAPNAQPADPLAQLNELMGTLQQATSALAGSQWFQEFLQVLATASEAGVETSRDGSRFYLKFSNQADAEKLHVLLGGVWLGLRKVQAQTGVPTAT